MSDNGINSTFMSAALWRFGFLEGHVACHTMRFHPNGTITGYESQNEALWDVDAGQLVIMNTAAVPTSRFDTILKTENSFRLTGKFLHEPLLGTPLELERVDWASRPNWIAKAATSLKPFIDQYGFEVGDHTYGPFIALSTTSLAKLSIGKYTSSAGCTVALANHRPDFVSTYPFSSIGQAWPSSPKVHDHTAKGDVVIGSDVWIASGVSIGSGVIIGDGAIIGAHSVVTRDIPPYAIAVGNPAKVIRYRFEANIIDALLALRWWDLPDHHVDTLLPLMLSTDISTFIAAAQALKTGTSELD